MLKWYFICVISLCGIFISGCKQEDKKNNLQETASSAPITLKVGHVGHDHHLPLFVALDMSEDSNNNFMEKGFKLKKEEDKKHYTVLKDGKEIIKYEIVKVGGGSKMPTALSQGVIDVGFGGVAPILAAIDKGAPLKLISPLHSKGDMFVLSPSFPANNWNEFIQYAKKSKKPIRIGYKSPVAIAKIIFENALLFENISYSSNISDSNVKVHLINVKGGGKLNSSLSNEIIDGYVGNNPFPAIGEDKKLLKIIADLEALPPGNFKNHPCCSIAGVVEILDKKSEAVILLLQITKKGVDLINKKPKKAAKIASRWIGTSENVELKSILTSGYSMTPSSEWHNTMSQWFIAMNKLGFLQKQLKSLSEPEIREKAYDFSYLNVK